MAADGDDQAPPCCRICRMEATEENKLYHPCRCKGTIKYVHEPCLFEWMESKRIEISRPGTTAKCDICGSELRMRTIYEDRMGWDSLRQACLRAVKYIYKLVDKFVSIGLILLVFGIWLPVAWGGWCALCSAALDGAPVLEAHYPEIAAAWLLAVGVVPVRSSSDVMWEKLALGYGMAALSMVATAALTLGLYTFTDMIVHSEAFPKMLLLRIGPKYSNVDLLRDRLRQRFPDLPEDVAKKFAVLADLAIRNDIPEFLHNIGGTDNENWELPLNLNRRYLQALLYGDDFADRRNIPIGRDDIGENIASLDELDADGADVSFNTNRNDTATDIQTDDIADDINETPLGSIEADVERNAALQDFVELLDAHNAEMQERHQEMVQLPQFNQHENDWEAGEQNDVQGFHLDIKITLLSAPLYSFVITLVFGLFLLVTYVLPVVIGRYLLSAYSGLLLVLWNITSHIVNKFAYLLPTRLLKVMLSSNVASYAADYLLKMEVTLSCLFHMKYFGVPSPIYYPKALPLITFYATLMLMVIIATDYLGRGYSVVNRMRNERLRKLYTFAFGATCTIKVFILIYAEIFGFPYLSGLMVKYAVIQTLVPLASWQFLSHIPLSQTCISIVQYALDMMVGLHCMYMFASFIGTVRKHIIRPGVLFFIRSPDAPNMNILQDNLLYSMKIHFSRLSMSLFMYMTIIIGGIGFHTKLLLPFLFKNGLYPLNMSPGIHAVSQSLVVFYAFAFIGRSQALKDLGKQYWTMVFNICCRRLRLSSFVLDKDIPMERGYVIYRNYFYKYLASKRARWSNRTLYSSPTTHEEAQQLFRADPSVHAYFVPDGCLMRVPASDLVSRNYVQMLFVPVTKNDKLLVPLDLDGIKRRSSENAGEFSHLAKQNTDFDTYTVVYVPPSFKLRYSLLLLLIWAFTSLLFISVGLGAHILGQSVLWLLTLTLPSHLSAYIDFITNAHSFTQLNLYAICVGLVLGTLSIQGNIFGHIATFYHNQIGRHLSKETHADHEHRNAPTRNEQRVDGVELAQNEFTVRAALHKIKELFTRLDLAAADSAFSPFYLFMCFTLTCSFIELANEFRASMLDSVFYQSYWGNIFRHFRWIVPTNTTSIEKDNGVLPFILGVTINKYPHFLQRSTMFERLFCSCLYISAYTRRQRNTTLFIPLLKRCCGRHIFILGFTLLFQILAIELEYQFNASIQDSRVAIYQSWANFMSLHGESGMNFSAFQHIFYLACPLISTFHSLYEISLVTLRCCAYISQKMIDELYGKGKTLIDMEDDI
ncbi:AaceriADL090Wp [[Ashbya] aceris (nom. inval.)]|nr:AaceriADL090Wp [[Ashbya] aceris (nom. inval.)]